jgi:SOUL heme-binding protein
LVLVASLCVTEKAMAKIEEPAYALIEKSGDFELRDYAPITVAEIVVDGDRDSAVSTGFRALAGYIFGGNVSRTSIDMTAPVTQAPSEKIAMTAPVMQSAAGAGWIIRFAMPSSYRLDNLPQPNDRRITFHTISARRVAVLKFSGFWSDKNLNDRREELTELLKQKKLKPKGNANFAFYDPPWIPFFWRRNEILQDIESH